MTYVILLVDDYDFVVQTNLSWHRNYLFIPAILYPIEVHAWSYQTLSLIFIQKVWAIPTNFYKNSLHNKYVS